MPVSAAIDPTLSLSEMSALAEEVYIYAYPVLVGYGFFYRQALDPTAPDRQSLNRFTHFRTIASPTMNNRIPWMNTDLMNSACWLDLRAEPMVLNTPAYEPHRYRGIQMNDWYTMTFCTRSSRDAGNGAACYLITGPGWRGEKPAGVDEVIESETWIVKLFTRCLLESANDVEAIHRLQDQCTLRPLSEVLGVAPPPPAPDLHTLLPNPSPGGGYSFLELPDPSFISLFNTVMTMAPVHPSETALFARFARLGVTPGAIFDIRSLTQAQRAAIQRGIDAGLARINARVSNLAPPINGWVYPLDLRGGRDVLAGSPDAYFRRAVIAKYAIWGPPSADVVYMTCEVDSDGHALHGAQSRYRLRFDTPPPATGFWSFTVYDAATRLLVAHPSGRYKRGDRDRDMVRGVDGSLTLYLQYESPGAGLEANWLPIPQSAFQIVGRLYSPLPEVLDLTYKPPPITAVR